MINISINSNPSTIGGKNSELKKVLRAHNPKVVGSSPAPATKNEVVR
jgi:hypothetical protein